jgi:hypothetical protein
LELREEVQVLGDEKSEFEIQVEELTLQVDQFIKNEPFLKR